MLHDITLQEYNLMISAHGISNEDSSDDSDYDEADLNKYFELFNRLKPPPLNIEKYSKFIAQPDKKINDKVDYNDNISSNKNVLRSFADVLKNCDNNVVKTENTTNIIENNDPILIKKEILLERLPKPVIIEEVCSKQLESIQIDPNCNNDLGVTVVNGENVLTNKTIKKKAKSVIRLIGGLKQEEYDLYWHQWTDEILKELKSNHSNKLITSKNEEQLNFIQPSVIDTKLDLHDKNCSIKSFERKSPDKNLLNTNNSKQNYNKGVPKNEEQTIFNRPSGINSNLGLHVKRKSTKEKIVNQITIKKPNNKSQNKKQKNPLVSENVKTEGENKIRNKTRNTAYKKKCIDDLHNNLPKKPILYLVNYNYKYQKFDYGAIDKLRKSTNKRKNFRSFKVFKEDIFFEVFFYLFILLIIGIATYSFINSLTTYINNFFYGRI